MELTMAGVGAREREILASLLGQFLPHTQVWAFGSRIKGNPRPYSDLDLVAFTKREQKARVSLLKEAFDESNLPFRVDLLEWDSIPDTFKENIKALYADITADDRVTGTYLGRNPIS
jgi:predicted nucleotidyltransferase